MPRAFPAPAAIRRVTGKVGRSDRVSKHMPFRSFTPEVKAKVIECVKAGEFGASAARKARISEKTLHHWLRLGEDALTRRDEGEELSAQDQEFAEFFLDVFDAEGQVEGEAVGEVRTAGRQGNWVASMAYLERRFGKRWHKTETMEHVGPGGGPIQHEQLDNSASTLAELLGVLQDAGVIPQGIKGLPEPANG